jgi:hypothetical protein
LTTVNFRRAWAWKSPFQNGEPVYLPLTIILGVHQVNTIKIWQLTLIGACVALAALSACSSKTAVEKGEELATTKLDMATGVGNALQAKGAEAGESVVGGVGTVIRGMERGVMKSGRSIVLDPALVAAGLKVTKVQDAAVDESDKPHGLDAYVVSASAVSGTLRVLMFDAMDNEIGRASVKIDRNADEAKYETLPLDPQVDQSAIRKVAFVFKPGTSS